MLVPTPDAFETGKISEEAALVQPSIAVVLVLLQGHRSNVRHVRRSLWLANDLLILTTFRHCALLHLQLIEALALACGPICIVFRPVLLIACVCVRHAFLFEKIPASSFPSLIQLAQVALGLRHLRLRVLDGDLAGEQLLL